MKTMRNFWEREWLMRDIGAKHGTDDLSTIIKIAQTAGLLGSNAEMTEAGQIYMTANRHRVEVLKHDTTVIRFDDMLYRYSRSIRRCIN